MRRILVPLLLAALMLVSGSVVLAQPVGGQGDADSLRADSIRADSIRADSIAIAQRLADSLRADSIAIVEQARADSIVAYEQEMASRSIFAKFAEFFRKGGPAMWAILLFLASGLAIFVERFIFLFFTANIQPESFMARVAELVRKGSIEGAIATASEKEAPLARVIEAALRNYRGTGRDIQNAVDEMALAELPRLSERTNYLGMLANVSTMVGLLGTIFGLIAAFAAVAAADPETKSTLLANGISQAMNTTAFGLIAAIPQLMAHAFLTAKADRLTDDIDRYSVMVMNMLAQARKED